MGTRELIELTSIEEAGTDRVQVLFRWKWKPNDVGWHLDINPQTGKLDPPWKRKSNPQLSSGYPFKGTAEMSRIGNRWEVKSIKWNLEMPERAF